VAAAVQQCAGKVLDDLLDTSEHVSSPLKEEVLQCIDNVATVTADLFAPEEGEYVSRSRTTSPIRSPSRFSESAATALLLCYLAKRGSIISWNVSRTSALLMSDPVELFLLPGNTSDNLRHTGPVCEEYREGVYGPHREIEQISN
jgi:hypothetical protein